MKFLTRRCHEENARWWKDLDTGEPTHGRPHVVGEKLMLVVTELAEAMEGHRKDLWDAHLPHRKAFDVELADAMIRIFDLAGALKCDLADAFVEKLHYNQTRADHTDAARKAPGGKKV